MTTPRPAGECYQALAVAEDLPYGPARTALVEDVVAEADVVGDLPLAVEARLDLVTAYTFGGEPLKRLPVFAWLLARHDERPFEGAHRHRLLWQYKWLTTGATDHPDVPLEVVLATLEDMERRYRDAGEPPGPVLGCRYRVHAHLRGAAAAQAEYDAWVRAARSRLSDCRACEPTQRVRHLAELGRHDEAVAEALPVLSGQVACAEQPASMIAHSLPSLLLGGHAARAATEHLRGARQTRHDPSGLDLWAAHVSALTRAGRLQRAVDLLVERLHEIDAPPTPRAGMTLAAAAAALCARLVEQGWGEQVLTPRQAGTTVPAAATAAALVDPLTRLARAIADRFDARNGTRAVGEAVDRLLQAAPLPDLPLDLLPDATLAVRAGRRAAPEPPPARPAPAAALTLPAPGSLAALAAGLEAARQSGDRAQRERALVEWRARRDQLLQHEPAPSPSPAWDPADADRQRALDVARLDCAAALDDLEHDPSLLHATRALGARLHDAGDEAGAYRFELWWLREAVTAGLLEPDDAVRAADDVVAEMRTGVSGPDRATAHLALLALLHVVAELRGSAPDMQARHGRVLQAALQAMAAADPGTLDGYQRGCYALLLRLDAASSAPPQRAERLVQALSLLPPGVRRGERALIAADLAALHAEHGEPAQALQLLAEAEPDAQAAGDTGLATYVASLACRLLSGVGESVEAVDAARRAVRHAEQGSDPLALDQARQSLVHALRQAGRELEAAEIAELALGEARQRLQGDAPGEEDLSPARVASHLGHPHGPARPDVHLVGTLAWAAAVCAEALDEQALAHRHARTSAVWHLRNGSAAAVAEACEVAARTAPDPGDAADLLACAALAYDAAGLPWQAAVCRRNRAFPLAEAHGVDAALDALDEADEAVDRIRPDAPDRARPDAEPADHEDRVDWERLALTEQSARVLAQHDRYADALARTEELPEAYRLLGDVGSAWDVVALQARLCDALGRPEVGVDALGEAVEEAHGLDPERAADLADLLAQLWRRCGDAQAAAAVLERYGRGAP
ncbi:MAG: hypothetical protein U0Q15_15875 [Kineosporiaceae bacterium]